MENRKQLNVLIFFSEFCFENTKCVNNCANFREIQYYGKFLKIYLQAFLDKFFKISRFLRKYSIFLKFSADNF